jgi:tetratricopeptide (TPR) repeat protein
LVQNLWHNSLVEAVAVWRYVYLLLVPVSQSLVHSVRSISSALDPAFLLSVAAYLALAAALFWWRRRLPVEVLGVCWFFLLVAQSHVIPLQEAIAEHRIYTASGGIFLAAAGALRRLSVRVRHRPQARRLVASVAVLVVLVLAVLTVMRNRVWADPVTLWGDAAAKAPDTWAAQYGLAEELRQVDRCEEALAPFRRAIELLPERIEPYLNAGICLAELERYDESRASFRAALELDPTSPKAHNNLGTLAARVGRYDEARGHFEEAIRCDPANVRARQLLARLTELAFDDPARALELCQEIRELEPSTPGIDQCIERNRRRLNSGS